MWRECILLEEIRVADLDSTPARTLSLFVPFVLCIFATLLSFVQCDYIIAKSLCLHCDFAYINCDFTSLCCAAALETKILEHAKIGLIHRWGHHVTVTDCDTQPHNSLRRPGLDPPADSTLHAMTRMSVPLHNTLSFNYPEN